MCCYTIDTTCMQVYEYVTMQRIVRSACRWPVETRPLIVVNEGSQIVYL